MTSKFVEADRETLSFTLVDPVLPSTNLSSKVSIFCGQGFTLDLYLKQDGDMRDLVRLNSATNLITQHLPESVN